MITVFKKDLVSGALWSVSSQATTLFLLLITNIWMARLLTPTDFGQIGIITFFTLTLNVVVESGFGGALVRDKKASIKDYSTAFVSNVILSVIVFVVICVLSGSIAEYYRDPKLQLLLITASSIVIINAFHVSKTAKLISDMKFKQEGMYRFCATFISSVIGIGFAYFDFGVWSVIYMQLLNSLVYTVILWRLQKYQVYVYFSKKSFRKLYSFGLYTTLSSILNTFFDNVYQLVFARFFSFSQTGNYYQAKKLQDIPGGILNSLTQGVLFSSLSKYYEDTESFIRLYNKIIRVFLVILGFISAFFIMYSTQLIDLLLGPKWGGAAYYMRLLTIASFFYMQESFSRMIFKVYNRTRFILVIDLLKKGLQGITIAIGIYYKSIELLIYGFIFTSVVGYSANYYFSRVVLRNMDFLEVLTVLKVIFAASLVVVLFKGSFLHINSVAITLCTIPIAGVCYMLLLHILRVVKLQKNIHKWFNDSSTTG